VTSRLSPPDDTHHERNKPKKTKTGKSRMPPQTKLPTPPIDDDDGQDVCDSCGGVCQSLKQDPANGRIKPPPRERIQDDRPIPNGDPKMTIGVSLINPFEEKFSNKKDCPNSNVLIQHCKAYSV
jgi:hypothetical protein